MMKKHTTQLLVVCAVMSMICISWTSNATADNEGSSMLERLKKLELRAGKLERENSQFVRRMGKLERENNQLKNRFVKGEYRGDGRFDRVIELGFEPKAVFWHLKDNDSGIVIGTKAGFCLNDKNGIAIAQGDKDHFSDDGAYVRIVENGFMVTSEPPGDYFGGANIAEAEYVYLAIK